MGRGPSRIGGSRCPAGASGGGRGPASGITVGEPVRRAGRCTSPGPRQVLRAVFPRIGILLRIDRPVRAGTVAVPRCACPFRVQLVRHVVVAGGAQRGYAGTSAAASVRPRGGTPTAAGTRPAPGAPGRGAPGRGAPGSGIPTCGRRAGSGRPCTGRTRSRASRAGRTRAGGSRIRATCRARACRARACRARSRRPARCGRSVPPGRPPRRPAGCTSRRAGTAPARAERIPRCSRPLFVRFRCARPGVRRSRSATRPGSAGGSGRGAASARRPRARSAAGRGEHVVRGLDREEPRQGALTGRVGVVSLRQRAIGTLDLSL